MNSILQKIPISFTYPVHFTEALFDIENPLFAEVIEHSVEETAKVLFVLDEGMYNHHPDLFDQIKSYASHHEDSFNLIDSPVFIPGGEQAKNDSLQVQKIYEAINKANLDRHSYIAAIGGGSVIDTAGYAAATAHRGIRLIRIPTTILAQNDAAVGVKNSINAFGKKNFLGTFTPPYAVLNDVKFLDTLHDRDWRAGISEAIKVALLKDSDFFDFLDKHASALNKRNKAAMQKLIYRCAQLHLNHIATSGDPFEMGSSRPLDFGHWSAHKLEQLTHYELRHGEAVAIGIALDVTYSYLQGIISKSDWQRILKVFKKAGFQLFVPELTTKLEDPEDPQSIFYGFEEFREHLGGELTIMLLRDIGEGKEVHEVDLNLYRKAVSLLSEYEEVAI